MVKRLTPPDADRFALEHLAMIERDAFDSAAMLPTSEPEPAA